MNIDKLFEQIIMGDNTLSEVGREQIVYELIDIYSKMPQPVSDVGVMTFTNLPDKELVLTLMSAYEAFAIKHFLICGKDPQKIEY